jgi:hypothetical protein
MAGAVYEDPRHYKDDNVADLCQTAVCCRMPLTRLEPEDRDLPPHSRRLDATAKMNLRALSSRP